MHNKAIKADVRAERHLLMASPFYAQAALRSVAVYGGVMRYGSHSDV